MASSINPRAANYLCSFVCLACESAVNPTALCTTCPNCGGNLDARYHYDRISRDISPIEVTSSRDRSLWHYGPFLPCSPPSSARHTPLGDVGWSPLYRAYDLETRFNVRALWLKADSMLPSSSFKDRASAMVIAQANALGIGTIVVASTGNAAAALATLCAGTTIRAVIFVPMDTPEGKLAQILINGATVYRVRGTYADCVRLAREAAEQFGWYNRTTGVNPYTREGKKTAGFEIAEQLGEDGVFRAPDVVVVPVGDGNIISGVHKGFAELKHVGWIEEVPRFIGVTATRASSLFDAWKRGDEKPILTASTTIASGISVDFPEDAVAALRAVRSSGGIFIEAQDDELLSDMALLARSTGVFVEPSSAAALTGLRHALDSGTIRHTDQVVLQMTGHGLKDPRSALKAASPPRDIYSLNDMANFG